MGYTYSYKGEGTHAKALGNSLGISTKHAREISKHIRGMPLEKAKTYLAAVQELKQAVPFKRHNRDVGHKKGMAAGRYPVKASKMILKLLQTAEANAQNKGMSVQDLVIIHIVSNRDSATYKHGRQRGVKAKKTHVEVILQERKIEKKVRKSKMVKKTAPKVEEEKKVVAEEKKEVPRPVVKEAKETQSDSGRQNSEEILDEKKPEAPKPEIKEEKKPEAQESPKAEEKQEKKEAPKVEEEQKTEVKAAPKKVEEKAPENKEEKTEAHND